MIKNEIRPDLSETMTAFFETQQRNVWTALPGIVKSVNYGNRTCSVAPAVAQLFRNKDGSFTQSFGPEIYDCPIVFPGSSGWSITFPIAPGDEVLIVFSSRCIDPWWSKGGIQPQVDLRMHDLSDAMVIPGLRSHVNSSPIDPSSVSISNSDNSTGISLLAGTVTIKGSLVVQGSVTSSGAMTTPALSVNNKDFSTHKHTDTHDNSITTGPI